MLLAKQQRLQQPLLSPLNSAQLSNFQMYVMADPSPQPVPVGQRLILTHGGGGRTGATQTLPQGGYNVTLTDKNGCVSSTFLNVPGAFTLSLKIGKLRCFGDCDAAIDALPSGGTTPISYKWNNGAITQSIVGIPAGTYSVTATDANGCSATASGTVINPPLITVTTTVVSPACGGGATGSATVNATGGVAPFTYLWSNGQTTQTATNLAVGTYSVTATDANGCGRVATAVIVTKSSFTLNLTKTDAACGASNGSANVTATGTAGVVSYKWSTGAISQNINGIPAGNYSVTVTDGSGCSSVGSVTVNTTGGNLVATVAKADATCGIANGMGTVTVTSGTAPYKYAWSNGSTDASVKTLSAGSYTITVTDASGCTTILNFSIATSTSFTVTTDVKNVNCNGGTDGQITAMVMGGSAPYTYTWSTGSTVNTIVNLKAGAYSVSVKDNSGCTGTASATITQPDALNIGLGVSNSSCNASNGGLTASVSGGTAPYKYQWSNGATTANISNVAAGTYTVTVTDSKNCTASKGAAVSSSTGVALTVNVTNPVCSDGFGAATATVSGGAAPYKYAWSNGAATASVSGLAGGNYTLSVTDVNGCTAVQNFAVNTPVALTVSISTQATSCGSSNGSATATLVNGGTAPFSYNWNTGAKTSAISNLAGGTYLVTVTDANGCSAKNSAVVAASTATTVSVKATNVKCNGGTEGTATATVSDNSSAYQYTWSTGAKTATISNLKAGTYTVTASNSTGCTAVGTVTITQPAAIAVSTTSNSATCLPTGSATVVPTNGVAPYTYSWSNGAKTATISNVLGGVYSVTVTDANGCAVNTNVTVQSLGSPNFTVSVALVSAITEQGSANGSVMAVATNGTAPYTYKWNNGYVDQTISNLAAGTYTVTVTDKNGCTAVGTIKLTEPTCSNVTDPGRISGNQSFCKQSEITPIIEAAPAIGGTGAITYMWMYSTVDGAFSQTHYKLVPGSGNTKDLTVFPDISVTTYFARCARRSGCGTNIESNIVTKSPIAAGTPDGPTSVCIGANSTYTVVGGSGGTYNWFINGSSNPTGTGASISTRFLTTGTKTVSLTITTQGCVKTVNLTVNVVSCVGISGLISSFSSNVKDPKNIELNWITKDESQPSEYVVEHSADGSTFDIMAEVPSQNGTLNEYSFVDQTPKTGRNFYRIKHLEANGDVSYSEVRQSIVFPAQGEVITYPNPASTKLYVEMLSGSNLEGTIEVFNTFGRVLKSQTFSKDQNRYEIDLSALPSGTFIVRLTTSDGEVKSVKMSKE